jgi:hypothetical protein
MEFKNEWNKTRSGFSHTSELYDNNNNLLATSKCNYLNRTWESYSFQTSMKDAVHKAIENEIQFQKDLQGIKRLTQQKRDEIINYSSIINELKTLYKTL